MNENLVMKYFELLYPDFDNMEPHEQYIAAGDEIFIRENLDEIDRYYQECKVPGTYAYDSGKSDSEIIRLAVMENKAEEYFKMLHPEFESLNPAEQFAVLDDKMFITDNIEVIDTYYRACQAPDTYAQEQGFTDKEILQLAVEEEKARKQEELQQSNNGEARITLTDIEEATQGTRIESFKQATKDIKEASKEEPKKNTKDGVSIDD